MAEITAKTPIPTPPPIGTTVPRATPTVTPTATSKPEYNPETGQMEIDGQPYDPTQQPGYVPLPGEPSPPTPALAPPTPPTKVGVFTRAEITASGLTSDPKDWEMRGYRDWYVSTKDGRQIILADIARARASSRPVTAADLARVSSYAEAPVITEEMRKRAKEFVPDFTVRRSMASIQKMREQHLASAISARETERASGGTVHGIDYHLRQAQLPVIAPSKPEVVFPDTTKKRRELESALEYGKSVLSGEALLPPDIDRKTYEDSLKDIRTKLELIGQIDSGLDSWKKSGRRMPSEVVDQYQQLLALTTGPVSPFVDLAGQTIDLPGALWTGVSDKELRATGLSQIAIAKAKRQIRSGERWAEVETGVQQIRAEDRAVSQAALSAFESKLPTLPKFLQDAYRTGGIAGYNAAVAIYNETLRTAGAVFPPAGETSMVSEKLAKYAHSDAFREQYIAVVRPAGMSDADYNKLIPYISPAGFDTGRAIVDGVPIPLIERFTGLDLTGPPTPEMGLLPAPATLAEYWPQGIPMSPPKGFPSDAEYATLSTRQKLNLNKKGDVRATFAVTTWMAGVDAATSRLGMAKPIEAATTKLIPSLDPIYQDIKLRLDADPNNKTIQQEMSAYWQKYGRAALQSAAIVSAIPAITVSLPSISLGSIPILSRVAKTAVDLAVMLAGVTPTIYAGASIVETAKAGNLERQWQNFQTLPKGQQDFWAKQAGFSKSFASLTETEKAFALLRYTPPAGVTLAEWGEKLGEVSEKAHEYTQKGSNWIRKNTPETMKPVIEPVVFAMGTVAGAIVEAPVYMGMMPVIGASLVDTVPTGKAGEYAKEVATGMAAFFTTILPAAFKADPSYTSGRIVGLFLLGPGGLLKLAKGIGARLNLRSYVPERGMAIEYSTVKTPTRLGAGGELEVRTAVESAMRQLLEGKQDVTVTVGDGMIRLHYKGTVYQKHAPHTLFSAVTDIKSFDPANPGKMVLWTSPQLARRFMVRSASGAPMKNPGIVEVYVGRVGFGKLPRNVHNAPTLARMEQLASEALQKGYKNPQFYPPFKDYIKRIELEATSVGPFKRVPGRGGKGISANIEAGSYPIQRYVLDGLGLEGYQGLSAKQVLLIRAASVAEGMKTFFLGNYGRLEAVKAELGVKGVKAEFPSLRAMLRNEGSLKTVAEIIHGRERALKIEKGDKGAAFEQLFSEVLTKSEEKLLQRYQNLLDRYYKETISTRQADILRRLDKLGDRLNRVLSDRLLNRELGKYKAIFDQSTKGYEYSRDYGRGYISAYERLIYSALGRSIPTYQEDVIERSEYSPYRELEGRPSIISPRVERIELERVSIPEATTRYPEREPERPTAMGRIGEELPERPPREPEIPPVRPPYVPPERPPREPPPERPPYTPPERPPRIPPERPPYVPPERPPRIPPTEPPPTIIIQPRPEIVGKQARLPEGSIAWRQGIFWRWIPREDYTTGAAKPRTLPKGVTPIGAQFTDLRKPTETIQMIGDPGASVPDVAVDLGVADIFISDQAQTIRYTGKGLKTDVGVGVPGPAQGMTVDGGAEPKGHAYARKVYPASSVSRTDVSKEEPVRGGVREIRGKDRVDISRQMEEMQDADYSGILGFSDKDADDIFGTGERRQKKSVNRVRTKRAQPRRGRDNPTTLGGVRP